MILRTLQSRFAVVYEKDGKYCHKTADGREMCHATKAEAEAMVRKGIKHLRAFKASRESDLRVEQYQGREHIVVPVIALVEGVIHASNAPTPELVLSEEFAKSLQQWNGRPVMLNHPKVSDEQVSANDPKILEEYQIGTVFNAKVDGDKLKMEAWLDSTKMEGMGDEAKKMLASVRAGEMVEVSVGTYVVAENKKGRLGDKDYSVIWRDISSDHLAFLPEGTTGACSIEMGCGAPRAAGGPGSGPQKGGGSGGDKEKGGKDRYQHIGKEDPKSGPAGELFKEKQLLEEDLADAKDEVRIEREQNGKPNTDTVRMVKEIESDLKKVEKQIEKVQPLLEERKSLMEDMADARAEGDRSIVKEIKTDLRKIEKQITKTSRLSSEIELTARAAGCGCGGQGSHHASAEARSMDKKARVAAIIASGKTCFKTADAAVLEQLSDEAIAALETHIKDEPTTEDFLSANPDIASAVAAHKTAQSLTPEQRRETFFKENPDVAEVVTQHKAAAAAKKADLVGKLKTAQKAYSEVELQSLSTDQLEKIALLALKEKPSYEGQISRAGNESEVVPPAPSLKARVLEMQKA